MGGLGPLVLCTRVTNAMLFTDPVTLRHVQLDAPAYWRNPFNAMLSSRSLVEYVVLDIEPIGPVSGNGKWMLAEAQVARASDFGRNDNVFFIKTHLGHILHPGK